jgi:hypothetical protein
VSDVPILDVHPGTGKGKAAGDFQRALNPDVAHREGYRAVFVKFSQGDGTYDSYNLDGYWRRMAQVFDHMGGYHFLDRTMTGRMQAQRFVKRMKLATGREDGRDIAIWIDFEDYSGDGWDLSPTNEHLHEGVQVLREHVGRHPIGVYSNYNFWIRSSQPRSSCIAPVLPPRRPALAFSCPHRHTGRILRRPGKVLSSDGIPFPGIWFVVYEGRCHFGAVRFEVRTELEDLVRCNCSLCVRRSAVMHYVAPSDFMLISGEEQLATYRFGSRSAAHHFCKVCGIFPYFFSDWGGQQHYVVNVGCLGGVDPYGQETTLIDGESF